jgi:ferric-dicitrate binding protein FerR (iron transport regulator)
MLSTDKLGRLHIRAGDARLLLNGASSATWGVEGDAPAVTLMNGTAVFSTVNSKAFSLRAATALFRSQTDRPTVGSVTILNPKELIVRCSRGSLTITVEDDTRVVKEGKAYRVVLDDAPNRNSNRDKDAVLPPWNPGGTIPGGRTRFTWYLIGLVALISIFALHEALESPDRP